MSKLRPEKEVALDNERLGAVSDEEMWLWLVRKFYEAYEEARRGKLNTVNEQRFEENRDRNLTELAERVMRREYEPLRSVAFIITEPTPREIFAASFGDRVVHHFLIQQVGDFWEKRLSARSFSCREGKGTLYGVRTLANDMKLVTDGYKREAYVMKIDLLGYFMSLPRVLLYERVRWGLDRQFPEGGSIYDVCNYLWQQVIFDDPTDGARIKGEAKDWEILPRLKSLFYAEEGRGIVIGNLTSQWMSNMVLDLLDRYVQFELHCRYYGRYVDDAYFLAESREELLLLRDKVSAFVTGLGLSMHPKKFYLQPVSNGVAYLGAVVYPGRVVCGKRFLRNVRRLQREIDMCGLSNDSLMSLTAYRGLAWHYNYRRSFERIFSRRGLWDLEKWRDLM